MSASVGGKMMRSHAKIHRVASRARQVLEQANDPVYHYSDALGGLCFIASKFLLRTLQLAGYQATFVAGDVLLCSPDTIKLLAERHTSAWGPSFASGDESLLAAETTHCWVEYDGHIIDITATQFGVCEPVFICPILNASIPDGQGGGHIYDAYCSGPKAERLIGAEWDSGTGAFSPSVLMKRYKKMERANTKPRANV